MKKLSNKAKRALTKVLFFVVGGSMILISIITQVGTGTPWSHHRLDRIRHPVCQIGK